MLLLKWMQILPVKEVHGLHCLLLISGKSATLKMEVRLVDCLIGLLIGSVI